MENGFSSADICAIIKACGESGVIEFSLNNLKILFNGHPSQIQTPILVPDSTQVAMMATEKDEFALKDERLAHMDIEDPVEYEKLLMSGDLVNNSKVGEEDEDHSRSQPDL